jgi:hypothetical protein
MKTKTFVYWTATAVIAAELIAGGVLDLVWPPGLAHLGYPTYLLSILGPLRLAAGVVLLAPRLPRLKEWAYAGAFFELTGAALSILAVGDGIAAAATPMLLAAVAVASWALRPSSRTLGVLAWPHIRIRHRSSGSAEEMRSARP